MFRARVCSIFNVTQCIKTAVFTAHPFVKVSSCPNLHVHITPLLFMTLHDHVSGGEFHHNNTVPRGCCRDESISAGHE